MLQHSEIIYSITLQDILSAISRRHIDISSLSTDELLIAIEEVKSVLDDQFDSRPYLYMALDVWEITRHL